MKNSHLSIPLIPQMTVYSSVVADGAGSQLRMGLVASTGGGWAGCAGAGAVLKGRPSERSALCLRSAASGASSWHSWGCLCWGIMQLASGTACQTCTACQAHTRTCPRLIACRFGLPEYPDLMAGASAVIVWPSGKGACWHTLSCCASVGRHDAVGDSCCSVAGPQAYSRLTAVMQCRPVLHMQQAARLQHTRSMRPLFFSRLNTPALSTLCRRGGGWLQARELWRGRDQQGAGHLQDHRCRR